MRPADGENPHVSVVVPVRNGADTIGDCIEALLAGDFPANRRELLIVDNDSDDGTAGAIRSHPGVRYLHESRRGVSNARNRGIAESRGEVIAFLDGDCIPEPGWLTALVRPFDDPEVGAVAGELRHLDPATAAERQAVRILGNWQRFAVSSNPPYVVTANAAIRRSVLDRIGHFDPRLPRAQDVELGIRLHDLSGLRVVYSAEAAASHRHRSTQLGFFRQQLGWSFGAGLVGAKYRHVNGRRNDPPRLGELGRSLRGLGTVVALQARGRGKSEWTEDAWFGFLRQLAWYSGGRAGLIRGRRVFPDD
jgi:cellulose synthase/poly-beta-1,6-N-acetylglucosamine synthase-like glycosyltransferase